ncbi:maleylpyruvate isomerase N-terminal domain-containing protein [Streptomyces olivaceoviridis]|uniref:maleylpyruvate isomerase N-terminal domain-containing protein n=1 Tax=Streptomyces olivaceoviridis TaxID=1921 RepID=UPI0036C30568
MDDLITVSLGEVVRFHDGEARAQWLLTAAGNLVKALRAAGPDVHMWSPSGAGTTAFQASWGVMETAVHRADVQLSLGCAPDAVHRSVAGLVTY